MIEPLEGTVLCPRCERQRYVSYDAEEHAKRRALEAGGSFPALSRTDNATYICSPCGTNEAMRDWRAMPPIPPDEWPVDEYPIFTELNR